jgi:hypothetical protein
LTCEPRCGFLVFFLSPFHKIRPWSPPCCSYPSMGNSCCSAATVPSEPLPGPSVAELRPSSPESLHESNIKEESSIPPPSLPQSRPCSHSSASQFQSPHQSRRSSQDPTPGPRSRTKSTPQLPQTFKSSSPRDPRPRSRSVVHSKSCPSHSRPTGPGETIIESGP